MSHPASASPAHPVERLLPEVCGRTWIIERRGDLETLWDAIGEDDFGDDERLPYWVELWPSSLLLARWLHERQAAIAGRVCVDMGCGLGLSAIVASRLGARVAAFDYEYAPLPFARGNADSNGAPQPLWLQMDWRSPALASGCADYVWGGDVMYELRFVQPVTDFLAHVLAPGGRAWIAEPDRNIRAPFVEYARGHGFGCERVLTERFDHAGHKVTVHILELAKDEPAKNG